MKTLCVYFLLSFFLFPLLASAKKDVESITIIPDRIVSLSPSATEILFAIDKGESIIARTDFCNYPEQALLLPSIGGFDGKAFSLESIIALEPDFVYATKGMHDHLKIPLEKYGIQVYLSEAQSLEGIYDEIQTIARGMNKEEEGLSLIDSIQKHVEHITNVVQHNQKKSVYWEVWHEPYMSAGSTSYIHDIIEKAGGQNIFGDIAQSYPVVNEESILIRNPDVILFPNDSSIEKAHIETRPSWDTINAVLTDSIFSIEADIISRPGPRSGLAVELIARKLFPNESF